MKIAILAAALAASAAAPVAARADVIPLNDDATSAPVVVTVAPGDTLTFSYDAAGGGGLAPLSVATGGSIALASDPFGPSGTEVSAFETGSTIDGTLTYQAFPAASTIPYSVSDEFIGFAATLPDGTHYGYAEVAGPFIEALDLEGSVNAPAITGTVPEPAALVMLGTALVGLAAFRRVRAV